jgi:hypothetical protein
LSRGARIVRREGLQRVKRTLGLVFMILGVVGIVLSLVLIPVVWIGRGIASDYVTAAADQVNAPLQRAEQFTADFRASIQSLRGDVGRAAGEADGAVQRGTVEQRVATAILDVMDQSLGPAYTRLREAYVGLRERLASAVQAAATLRRLLPGSAQASLPIDEVAAVDAQLQAMDATLRDVRASLAAGNVPDGAPGVDLMRRIGDGMRGISARLDNLGTLTDRVTDAINQVQAQVAQTEANLQQILLVASVVLSILFAYLAALHATLVAYGRSLRRTLPEAAAPLAAAAAPGQVAEAESSSDYSRSS